MSRKTARDTCLAGEHPLCDKAQMILAGALLAAVVLDRLIFPWSAGLASRLPLVLRAVVAAMLLLMGVPLGLKAHSTLFDTEQQDGGLITSGVFARVRHPLYASEILTLLAVVIVSASTAGICVWVLFAIFMWYVARYEERLLRERFGQQYEDYARRVPMLVPRLLPAQPRG